MFRCLSLLAIHNLTHPPWYQLPSGGGYESMIRSTKVRLSDLHCRIFTLGWGLVESSAKGLTSGEISAHLAEVYGATVWKDAISRITDSIVEEMNSWWAPAVGTGLRGGLHRRDRGERP